MKIDRNSLKGLYEKIDFLESEIDDYKYICSQYNNLCESYRYKVKELMTEMNKRKNEETRQEKTTSRCF